MAQNDLIELPAVRDTRADFTALRTFLNRISLKRIADLYFTEDDHDRADDMRDELV